MNWLAGRIVSQSRKIRLHVQPRVIDVTAKEKETIAHLLEKLNMKGEIKVLAGTYHKGVRKSKFVAAFARMRVEPYRNIALWRVR
jgi:hypothetical protein